MKHALVHVRGKKILALIVFFVNRIPNYIPLVKTLVCV
jgi:hypothetical protein